MHHKLLIVKNVTHEGPGLLEPLLSELGIASHTVDLSKEEEFPDPRNYKALVVLGGPQSANDTTPSMQLQLRRIAEALDNEIPFLGICLGMQALVKAGGGRVLPCRVKETGFIDPEGKPYRIELTPAGRKDPMFAKLGSSFRVFQLHGETVELAASCMELLATSNNCPIQAVKVGKNGYGLQCHFELTQAMFSEWCTIDSDLKEMDHHKLTKEFEAIQEEYRATGVTLLHNFLRISGMA